jgi:hypothetical protein
MAANASFEPATFAQAALPASCMDGWASSLLEMADVLPGCAERKPGRVEEAQGHSRSAGSFQ